MPPSKKRIAIPVVRAVAWIVGTLIVVTTASHLFLEHVNRKHRELLNDPKARITRIVQTGPQREALSTLCLTEILELSSDRPVPTVLFNAPKALRRLTSCPVIERAKVHVEKPNTLYIDYSTRQPIAWLYDYVDVGLDEKSICFPVIPYFSPKKLPEIYLGLFEQPTPPSSLIWNQPLEDERLKLAYTILQLFSKSEAAIRRVDVSSAFAESCGKRQVVLVIEENCRKILGEKERTFLQPIFLRLSVKNIHQELGNYNNLRKKLWDTVDFSLLSSQKGMSEYVLPPRTIDLRIEGLAFIQQ